MKLLNHTQIKGQVSLEYIAVISFSLFLLIPITGYLYGSLNEEIRISKTQQSINTLIESIDYISSYGSGSMISTAITLPSGVQFTQVTTDEVQIKLHDMNAVFSGISQETLSGSLPYTPGKHIIYLKKLEDGSILISPTAEYALLIIGQSPSGTITSNSTQLTLTTNKVSTCKFDTTNVNYTSMSYTYTGTQETHWYALSNLDEGTHTYYSACVTENELTSATTTFIVNTTTYTPPLNNTNTTNLTTTSNTLIYDDFNRPNDLNIGGLWTEIGGQWDVLSNRGHADNCVAPGSYITTPVMDFTNITNATLHFDWEISKLDNAECLSTDVNDGSGWIPNIFSYCSISNNEDALGTQTINLLTYINPTNTVEVRFKCISDSPSEEVFIDNVNISVIRTQ